ncbi:hypothetical protein BDV25DRAFT_84140 [Aspergillus avenaceus]|uniref:UBX domain-containing protein n=1 Tax=Aspergillus avenaceus TaxID=36643 RepID=A0A5N6TZY4_ASPAV|nr:hypothetical protein BDV25DRAFT_84140 [Aspergillus avenaceus]
MKDTQEAGFLTSFCPVTKFPAAIVIKNGMLREYLIPDITKDDFYSRLKTVLEEDSSADQTQTTQSVPAASSPAAPASAPQPEPSPTVAPTSTPAEPQETESQKRPDQQRIDSIRAGKKAYRDPPSSSQNNLQKPQPRKPDPTPSRKEQVKKADTTKGPRVSEAKATKPSASLETNTPVEKRQPQIPSPPKQYRLQVRLFDGASIRSSFSPSQTIRGDVRPWIDSHMEEEKRPYNLKHILTPLPNRTLTIAEEEQSLAELGLGPTANLVMVPINTYTEAYSDAGPSFPVRAVSSGYGLVSSAVGTATGLVGSLFGYGPAAPSEPAAASRPAPSSSNTSAGRPRPTASRGPIIRTLRDQHDEQEDSQFYNGNQLNFEPRDTNR